MCILGLVTATLAAPPIGDGTSTINLHSNPAEAPQSDNDFKEEYDDSIYEDNSLHLQRTS